MSDKPEALRLADELDRVYGYPDTDAAAAELIRLYYDNLRLNSALKWEQDRSTRIGTHGLNCHRWGHTHYNCLLRQYESLLEALTDLIDLYDGRKHEGFAIVSNARAAIAKATGEAA